jgi:acetyl/propionyl-CoA carboxylase alpha subunit
VGNLSDDDLVAIAPKIGFPLLIKATAGGGGKGMREVRTLEEMPDLLKAARREAESAFGDGNVYLEKLVTGARHIEIQILADAHGNVIHLGERDCSIQRRHQKIIEETPSPALTPELRARMGAAAVAAAQAVGYTNAGTVEFLLAPDGRFYFLEMNTRLQVEHPITEAVTGIDLVKAQIRVAAGHPLPWRQEAITWRGHAIEARIYAEDPARHFLPTTGQVLLVSEPVGPGIRVDTGVMVGDTIGLYYDPMIAKLICWAEDRAEAVRKLDWALSHYLIAGVTTNIPYLQAIVRHPAYRRAELSTDFVERHLADWQPPAASPPDEVLIAAAVADFQGDGAAPTAGAMTPGSEPYSPWVMADGFRLGGG